MITSKRVAFVAVLFFVLLQLDLMPATASTGPVGTGSVNLSVLSFNKTRHQAPFLLVPGERHSALEPQLVYPGSDFSFPLLQSLYHDSSADCYTLMVSLRRSSAQQIVHLWRAQGFYRSGNGPYFELEDSDSLKAVTALDGTRFLFAQVGDGEWHCVSIHDSVGNYLLLDYRADGLISLVRDSLSRTAIPTYKEGRLVSLTQIWITNSGRRTLTTLLTNSGRY
jgi:hypothetical protein